MRKISIFLGLVYLAYTVYTLVVAVRLQQVYLASYGATFWDMPHNVVQYVAEKVFPPFGFSMMFFILPGLWKKLPTKRDFR